MFIWGLWSSYDVIVIMAALVELPLVIIFLFIFLSDKIIFRLGIRFWLLFLFYILSGVFLFSVFLSNLSIVELSYYDIMLLHRFDIISNDLYLIFHYYFIQSPIIVLYISFLIGFMSIVFSCLYLCIKHYKFLVLNRGKFVSIVRRQQLLKQNTYNWQMRFFQK
jgi:hypothetical protein